MERIIQERENDLPIILHVPLLYNGKGQEYG